MEKKIVAYQETYQDLYEVDGSLSDQEAVEKVQEDIRNGAEKGPETCIGSDCHILPDLDQIPEGHRLYWIPFAYERYGRLPVIASDHISRAELFRKGEEVLENLTKKQMEEYTDYLSDSEELDPEGYVMDGEGKILYNVGECVQEERTDQNENKSLSDQRETGPQPCCLSSLSEAGRGTGNGSD